MQISEISQALESIAPRQFAAEWDNVGLLVGARNWQTSAALLTIDLTPPVLREAIDNGSRMIVSYHPPIFHPLKSLNDSTAKQRLLLETVAAKVAVYSPHTALDAAPGGINDWLAEGVAGSTPAGGDVRPLQSHELLPTSEQCKIVVFCPAEAVDAIRNGLASVGAGQIGKYQLCSFEISGRGTFFAGDETNPAVGMRGSLQHVDEARLEMVCPKAALALAITTMKQFHPYEEPAFEIYPLLPRPQRHIGQGRRIVLDQSASLKTLVQRMKKHLGVKWLDVALGSEAPSRYERIGLCAGAGGSMLHQAIDQNCQLYFTGEMRHHDVLEAQARGCTVILAGHTNTERGYLKVLRKKLSDALPDLELTISRRDVNPLRTI